MKYILIFIVLVLAWKFVEELVLTKGSLGEDASFGERLRDWVGRLHQTVGMVAISIILIFLARLLYRAFFPD